MWYWVIQRVKGQIYAHGPYRTEKAAENRVEKVSGGEVHLFRSLSSNAEAAVQEFKDEEIRKL